MVSETDLQISRAENKQAKQAMNVGLIGTGRISDINLKTCSSFSELNIKVCGSLDLHQSSEKASRYGTSEIASPDEIIADESIDCILNLMLPAVHAEISLAALVAGKNVYSEKPFATRLEDGRQILDMAAARGLTVGNAPDTFLGGRWQTTRKILDSGVIGTPIGCMARPI